MLAEIVTIPAVIVTIMIVRILKNIKIAKVYEETMKDTNVLMFLIPMQLLTREQWLKRKQDKVKKDLWHLLIEEFDTVVTD